MQNLHKEPGIDQPEGGTINSQNNITRHGLDLFETVGQSANRSAAAATFADYKSRKADQTLRRQGFDLALFADYLSLTTTVTVTAEAMGTDPAVWTGITWGLVEGFVKWQLTEGYAVGSVNARLSTVKTYANMASKAGTITPAEYALIRAVSGYSTKEGRRIDQRRAAAGKVTRLGHKKATPVELAEAQATQLREQPDTPQGRRDALLFCLMLDHGLRVSEVAGLTVSNFDLQRRRFTFYRPKVDREQTHKMTPATFAAARRYLQQDAAPLGLLLAGSRKNGKLIGSGWSVQKMTARVASLGEAIGVKGLSPHDCRHYWATLAARNGTPIDRLQDAGGWSNPITPLTRYVQPAKVANEGVNLNWAG